MMTNPDFRASRNTQTCSEIAAARGRHARERSRDAGGSPLRGEVLFGVSWLASFMATLLMAPFPFRSTPSVRPTAYEPHPRELGVAGPLRHRQRGTLHGRYRAPPSMTRIMKDLRRPVAREAAREALLARVGGDVETLAWVAAHVDASDLLRLAVHARSGRSDAEVIASWRSEARSDREAKEAEIRARDKAHGPSETAEEGDEGGHVFAPPGR